MGLDDFTEKSLSDEERQRQKELSKNSPPGDESNWHNYEPGTPDWLSFINGGEKDNEGLPDLDRGVDVVPSEEVLVVNIEGVKSTTLISDFYVPLEDRR